MVLVRSMSMSLSLFGVASLSLSCKDDPTPAPPSSNPADPYVGAWNYDQPNAETGAGIATITCPSSDGGAPMVITAPQIGSVVLSKTGPASLTGATDQGCSWTFSVSGPTADLDPPSQDCFNKVIGSLYTLTRWSISLDGSHENEVVTAKSHLAVDCDFVLSNAGRTRVDPSGPDPTAQFVGTWSYDPPGPTGANVARTSCMNDAGPPMAYAPQSGTIAIAKTGDHAISAQTTDGCTWALHVDGNTAELAPAGQTCASASSSSSYMALASDGAHMFAIVSGQKSGCGFLLGNGRLTKVP